MNAMNVSSISVMTIDDGKRVQMVVFVVQWVMLTTTTRASWSHFEVWLFNGRQEVQRRRQRWYDINEQFSGPLFGKLLCVMLIFFFSVVVICCRCWSFGQCRWNIRGHRKRCYWRWASRLGLFSWFSKVWCFSVIYLLSLLLLIIRLFKYL